MCPKLDCVWPLTSPAVSGHAVQYLWQGVIIYCAVLHSSLCSNWKLYWSCKYGTLCLLPSVEDCCFSACGPYTCYSPSSLSRRVGCANQEQNKETTKKKKTSWLMRVGCASYVYSAVPGSHHRSVDWGVNKCGGGAGSNVSQRHCETEQRCTSNLKCSDLAVSHNARCLGWRSFGVLLCDSRCMVGGSLWREDGCRWTQKRLRFHVSFPAPSLWANSHLQCVVFQKETAAGHCVAV